MRQLTIQEFVSLKGQTEAARSLGLSQGSLSKAIRANRKIIVHCHDGGSFSAEESRPFPSRSGLKDISSGSADHAQTIPIECQSEQTGNHAVNPSSAGLAP
ncbi:Cro/CI family transcriptional regulator [Pseudomonas sp. NBRC 111135]|uniref:Cro/CI family transcriptional regulator n=1 Tax=Pseudomonas sp. NBRC 111135 TaxID=1661050 RepID=UPI0009E70CC7|nr:Cro/CI family transcriptional regulator [Pseudomonas sp. NBRC 111135]